MDRDYDVLFRVMILGDTGVGKTCMLKRFCDNEFRYTHVCTIGIDFKMRTLVMDGIRVRIQIWDTAGQERYRTITRQYFRKAQGIILAYDVTSEKSFMNIRNWAADIEEYADEEVCIALAGNKCDREDSRMVSTVDGEKLAADLQMPFSEVSAYTSENVSEIFAKVTKLILDKHRDEVLGTMKKRQMSLSESEGDGSEANTSEDEGIVKDLDANKSEMPNEVKARDFSCCNIL